MPRMRRSRGTELVRQRVFVHGKAREKVLGQVFGVLGLSLNRVGAAARSFPRGGAFFGKGLHFVVRPRFFSTYRRCRKFPDFPQKIPKKTSEIA